MYKPLSIVTLAICAISQCAYSQEVITPEKHAYIDSLNRYYIQTEQPLYLFLSTSPNDPKPTPISNSNSAKEVNKVEPMYLDGNGRHTIQHYDAICHKRMYFYVYADGEAPVTQCRCTGSTTAVGKQNFFGKDIHVSLSAKDDMSGVAQTYFSLNGAPFQLYDPQKPIATVSGENHLKYYSVDNVGNAEKIRETSFDVDVVAPKTFHTLTGVSADGDNIISQTSIVYLQASDDVSGVKQTRYTIDGGPEQVYDGKSLIIKQLPEGEHSISYYSIDKVNNSESPKTLKFFLDKTGPIVATDVLGDKFIVNDQIYFSGRTKLKLTAIDNKIGVKDTRYTINGGEIQTYKEPFYLPSRPGIHVVRYYAIDSLGNASSGYNESGELEYTHVVNKIYVDLTGPSLKYKFKGPVFATRDSAFISPHTEIQILGSDGESGLQKLMYTIDNNPTERLYEKPLTITEGGTHKLEMIGYDNVNNRNVVSLTCVVDEQPPTISTIFSVAPLGKINNEDVYPPYMQLFIAPSDNLTGIASIKYSINGGPTNVYQCYIDGFRAEHRYELLITVDDKLGNTSSKTVRFSVKDKI